jgi:gamma-glutamyltranspeptidase/glutathione hydrolase
MSRVLLVATLVCALSASAAFPRPATGAKGMVTTAHPAATEAARAVLARGGTAADAAVAAAFAIGVVEPYSAGIGGGGFAIVHHEGKAGVKALDFRERAPFAASRDMYQGDVSSVDGYRSVAVPGTVRGLRELHARHGSRPWAELLAPAIAAAEQGVRVDAVMAEELKFRREVLTKHPASRALFAPEGRLLVEGSVLKQPDLARVLRRIARDPEDFYLGEIAKVIAEDMAANGGLVSAEDLARYRPTWRQALCGPFRGYSVCSMPPPSSGGVHLLQMLNVLEDEPMESRGFHAAEDLHLMIEAMRFAYADRSVHLGDPAFTKVPVKRLISKRYAKARKAEIPRERSRRSTEVRAASAKLLRGKKESKDTSHLTVVDKDHNAVSLTFTVNWAFGSGVVVPGTGIVLNDEMDDFASAPDKPNVFGLVGGDANSVGPAKIPLSSMSPTIVRKGKKLTLAAGAPGGGTIITTVLQLVLNTLVFQMDAGEAVAAPRVHHQWLPDEVRYERFGLEPETKKRLSKMGHRLVERHRWGNANLIRVRLDGTLEGAADPRGVGSAAGVD